MKSSIKVAACLLLLGGLAAAATPWRIARSTVSDALGPDLVSGSILRAVAAGPVTFKLLPRPRIQAMDLTVEAEGGAVLVDAPVLKADLDIPSLMRGVWRMSAATLVLPTVTVDLDRLVAPPAAILEGRLPLGLRLRDGVIRLRSASASADLLATDVDASIRWGKAALAVSGEAVMRGTAVRFAGDLAHPLTGRSSNGVPARLRIESPLFTASADGLLSGDDQMQFAGTASLSTGSLPNLLRAVDAAPMAVGPRRAQISGDLVARPHDLSLSNAQLRLDHARFEGTLGWRGDEGRSLVAGTLATDLLDVDALVGDALDRQDIQRFTRRRLVTSPLGADIDLRISATAARIGRLTLEDAAIAALVRGDRLEFTLDEARAYGGLVKARALATIGPQGLDAHAEVSAKRVDLARLSDDLTGQDRVGGFLAGRIELDGRGTSLDDVIARATGGGKIGVDNGRLSGFTLARALRRLGRKLPADIERHGTPTTFDSAVWDVSVKDGILRIPDGRLSAPGIAMSFGAATHLPDGRFDVHAVAAETDGTGGARREGLILPFDMSGFWAGPLTLTGRDGALPGVVLPSIDGLAADR